MSTIAFCILSAALALIVGVILGLGLAAKLETKTAIREAIREAGLTKESTKLYGRAVRIFRRLQGLSTLDGDLANDILSPETKKLVDEWLAEHRALVESGKGGPAVYSAGGPVK